MKNVVQDLTSAGLLGVWGKWVKHAKYIYNIQDFNPEQVLAVGYTKSKFVTDAMMWFDKFSCKRSDLIITVGRDLVETVEGRFKGKKAPKTVMINNWIDENEIYPLDTPFYRDLAFGTGGLRGVIGAGTNRMNVYTVAKASQGLADYLKKNFAEPSVAIGYDSRIKSDVFAKVAAGVFAANGVKVNIWPVLMPVPTVSFATRYLHTSAGVMVTASHNPSKYNGYKVYGADGCQITTEAAAEILAEIEKLDIFADVKTGDFEAGVANGSIHRLDIEISFTTYFFG